MGPWDIVILLIVALMVSLAVFVLVRSHKAGKSSCGCGCAAGCEGCPGCQMRDEKKEESKPPVSR
ncbi:MAG: FeoB-associated Cys-rich membrane protein [Lachnospiraceae bacterium]|nr:FeoB-associated Cys-rich membrane protein [Lachnospiraceae bacterium]